MSFDYSLLAVSASGSGWMVATGIVICDECRRGVRGRIFVSLQCRMPTFLDRTVRSNRLKRAIGFLESHLTHHRPFLWSLHLPDFLQASD
jgi:hypothetical protein